MTGTVLGASRQASEQAILLIGGPADCQEILDALCEEGLHASTAGGLDGLAEACSQGAPSAIVMIGDGRAQSWSGNLAIVREHAPEAHVVLVCSSIEGWEVRSALAAGAAGVVLAAEVTTALGPCLAAVRAGQVCVPQGNRRVVERPVLSAREKQILGLVVMGYMNGQIAEQLFLAESTVKSHLSSAFAKLGVRSRYEAVDLILDPERGLALGILALGGEPLDRHPKRGLVSAAAEIPLTVMDHRDPDLFGELMSAIEDVAATGAFTGGAVVQEFESEYADWCEVPHAVGVSSGTEALVLALRALEIGPGDEVVVPANSFIATAEAVSLVGARPRFADVDPHTQLITAATIEPALTEAVRCVIPVHLYGRTAEMQPILELASERRLRVIEDAAQAHGARYRGKRVGTLGDAGTFSFYPAKNLGAWGDGGAVVLHSAELAERVRLLRSHGESPRYHHRIVGTTGRLDALQAAVLRLKLRRLEHWNEVRRRLADDLRDALQESEVHPPTIASYGCDHVYHQFVVRTPRRDQMRDFLARQGIVTGIHYPIPIHRSDAYRALSGERDVAPVASGLAQEILSLPIFPGMEPEQVERIGEATRQFTAQADPSVLAAS